MGPAVCPLPYLRQSGIAAHCARACSGQGFDHRAFPGGTCVSLRALSEQIPFPKAAPARGKKEAAAFEIHSTKMEASEAALLEVMRRKSARSQGEVSLPGAYDLSSLSTPLNALFAAGGVTTRGSLRHLQHYRGNQLVEEVDGYDLLLHGIRGSLQRLENGDSLRVPPLGASVTIDGMVRRPAVYELRGETNLSETLELAGGILPAAALRHIEVQRLDAHEKRRMPSLEIGEGSDKEALRIAFEKFAVQDGDEIHIFPIAPYNTQAVYLEGHVLRPTVGGVGTPPLCCSPLLLP